MEASEFDYLAGRVADLIYQAGRVVVFTGAGISTESGIPDFRGTGGIWTKFDPDDFTIQKFMGSREARKLHWSMLCDGGLLRGAEPNTAHYAIAELEKLGKLECIITQNVDNLHQKAGNSPEKVVELHGNMRWVRCMSCDRRVSMEEVLPRFKEEEIPDCQICNGILKPDVVFFGEALPIEALSNATFHSRHCDLFMVVGSTLVVYPAAYMPMYARETGAKLVILNLGFTPMDSQATVLISAKAGETMSKIVDKFKCRMSP
jgi:NAD-dependent deacetylase